MTELELTPQQIEAKRAAGESMCLIDCREPEEWALCRIEGANLLPMHSTPAHLQQLDAQAEETLLVVYCHHGVRSLNVVSWLRAQGVDNCVSMTGGIDRWSREIDPAVPRY
ncbi:MAG: rhodanese [Acidobacteriaceae bacterium]|jgi:rhodanese-related sulfurtransferase|nr:rhodanese [Acidobacteriaceae bacterium]